MHALVTSKLDYLYGLLYGLPACELHKLQLIQNKAARIVSRTHIREHITPVLRSLHWLPVKFRVQFKMLTLTYRALHGGAPQYLTDLLASYNPPRNLRSDNALQLVAPMSKTRAGDRADLPLPLRQAPSCRTFQKHLKTRLFSLAFDS